MFCNNNNLSLLLLLLLLSLSVFCSASPTFQKLPLPEKRIGPEAFAFDASGNGFYTGVSGGKILKYTGPQTGFVDFAQTSNSSDKIWCKGPGGTVLAQVCGRPAGLALGKTGELYIADSPLGLFVAPSTGGQAIKLADSADGTPFKFLDGLDVDPITGSVYFTSFSSRFIPSQVFVAVAAKDATGRLFRYDPATKNVTVLLKGLSGSAGCAVSSDGSYVLVSEFIKSQIVRYWIAGPKAGKSEIFVPSIPNPDNIKRADSGAFWVASVVNKFVFPTDPSAIKINSDGAVVQTISLKEHYGNTLVSEVNQFGDKLYLGTLTTDFAGVVPV